MKNYELLDIIGDVNEDYVQAADSNVVRPQFRWKALMACAACAALVLCAYPVWQGANSNSSGLTDHAFPAGGAEPQLHAYTVVGGDALATYDEGAEKISADDAEDVLEAAPADEPDTADTTVVAGPSADSKQSEEGLTIVDSCHNEDDLTMDGTYRVPCGDVPVQPAAEWYDALLRTYRLEEDPEWYGGAWLAGDDLLAVAIVDGFRTPELEAELTEAAGAGAVIRFSTVKYSMEFLNGLIEPAVRALDGSKLDAGVGVDVMANCLGVDLYSDGKSIPDDVLTALAHLDPDGDAIRVRLFVSALSVYDETTVKGPAPNAISTPVPGGAREFPAEEPTSTETSQPAQYDAQPGNVNDLPEAKYDVIYGDES